MITSVGRLRGWPVTITEPSLLGAQVELRPVRVRDAKVWRDSRVRNAAWLRPWEPTNPETPLYRSSVGPYVTMARTMRREARQGLALPRFPAHGPCHGHVRTDAGAVQRRFRVGRLPGPQPGSVADTGVAPDLGVPHPDRAKLNLRAQ